MNRTDDILPHLCIFVLIVLIAPILTDLTFGHKREQPSETEQAPRCRPEGQGENPVEINVLLPSECKLSFLWQMTTFTYTHCLQQLLSVGYTRDYKTSNPIPASIQILAI